MFLPEMAWSVDLQLPAGGFEFAADVLDESCDRVVGDVHHAQHVTVGDHAEDLFSGDLRRHRWAQQRLHVPLRGEHTGYPEVRDLDVGVGRGKHRRLRVTSGRRSELREHQSGASDRLQIACCLELSSRTPREIPEPRAGRMVEDNHGRSETDHDVVVQTGSSAQVNRHVDAHPVSIRRLEQHRSRRCAQRALHRAGFGT